MGFFSSKRTVYVSSAVYNLAGDYLDRPSFLKAAILGSAITPKSYKRSLSDDMIRAHMQGPSMQQRAFFRWARSNFWRGMPTASLSNSLDAADKDIASFLPRASGATVDPFQTIVEDADFQYWAEQHVLKYYPELVDTAWTADMNELTNTIVIVFPNGTVTNINPAGFDPDAKYLYCYYIEEITYPSYSDKVLLWIYKIGSGKPSLDALATNADKLPEFFPIIPLRLNNKSIRNVAYETVYDDIKKAYKKATRGQKIGELLDQIEANPSIKDLDFAFLVFGVPINTKDSGSQAYVYAFLKRLMDEQTMTPAVYNAWATSPTKTAPAMSTISLKSAASVVKAYDVRLSWLNIEETFHTGKGRTGAKAGDYWIVPAGSVDYTVAPTVRGGSTGGVLAALMGRTYKNAIIFRQITSDRFSRLLVRGMVHRNYVYGGKSVDTDLHEALADSDESGFYVPIHYPTVQKMSLVEATQMASSNMLLVFNAYQVVVTKWYQRGIFKILLMVVVLVVAVIINPGALASAGGLLGANIAVGTALGLTGAAAIVAGAVANALVATILTMVISKAATTIFGEELGAIIGTIVSFVAITVGTNFAMTGSTAVNWGAMMRADNLMKLTDVLGDSYGAWIKSQYAELNVDIGKAKDAYDEQNDEIKRVTEDLLGSSVSNINPIMFTDIQDSSRSTRIEPSEVFLKRTLLTGSDFVELGQMMIESFAELTLDPSPDKRGTA